MLFQALFICMLVLNAHTATAIELRNFLFSSLSSTTERINTETSTEANINNENGTKNESATIHSSKQNASESQAPSICEKLNLNIVLNNTTLYLLIISNTILIISSFVIAFYKFFIFLRKNKNKKSYRKKFDRRKKKNIVNNPHSESYFEDF